MASKGKTVRVQTVKLKGSARKKPKVNLSPTYGITGAQGKPGKGAVTQPGKGVRNIPDNQGALSRKAPRQVG